VYSDIQTLSTLISGRNTDNDDTNRKNHEIMAVRNVPAQIQLTISTSIQMLCMQDEEG
jgi:hypothetical protein